jgi:hypothetical protein
MQQLELWLGLVELKPLDRKAYGAAGAFTNIVTWANDLEGFRRKADVIAATGAAGGIESECDCLWHVPSLSVR